MVPSIGTVLTERLSPTVPALTQPEPDTAPNRAAIEAEIAETARENRIDARLVKSIVAAESGFERYAAIFRQAALNARRTPAS